MKIQGSKKVLQQIQDAAKFRLFLDYDGTLAEFATTPDEIHPDPELINLLWKLQEDRRFRIAVISGRRLSHIRTLVPIPGILLAGTYGIEVLDPFGERIDRVECEAIRPTLERIKPRWQELIQDHPEFYLEDKGWSLALHAKFVDQEIAEGTLYQARMVIDQADLLPGIFRIFGGHKFLEIAPKLANKGLAVQYLISRYPSNGALLIYIGDDDKDEEAFEVINQNEGIPIKVGSTYSDSNAQLGLESPHMVRQFLASLL